MVIQGRVKETETLKYVIFFGNKNKIIPYPSLVFFYSHQLDSRNRFLFTSIEIIYYGSYQSNLLSLPSVGNQTSGKQRYTCGPTLVHLEQENKTRGHPSEHGHLSE